MYSDVFWHILAYSGVLGDLSQKVPKRVLGGPEPHKCHYLTFSVEEINTLKEAIETLKNGGPSVFWRIWCILAYFRVILRYSDVFLRILAYSGAVLRSLACIPRAVLRSLTQS